MGYVYILTNYNKTVLYTGVTNNLQRRLYEHRMGINDSFTKRYHVYYLVYYEMVNNIKDAIQCNRFFTPCHHPVSRPSHKAFLPPF